MAVYPPGGFAEGTVNIIDPPAGPYYSISGVSSHTILSSVATTRIGSGGITQISPYGSNTLLYVKNVNMLAFSQGDQIVVDGTVLTIQIIHSAGIVQVSGAFTTTLPTPIRFTEPASAYETTSNVIATYEWALSPGTVYHPSHSTGWQNISTLNTDTIPHNQTWYIHLRATITSTFPAGAIRVTRYYHESETINTTTYVAPTDDCVGLACADPFSVGGGAVIEVDTSANPTNIFNPYAQNKSVNLYKQLNNIVSDLFGHQVNYFRTEPHGRTKDVTLMEYSLFSVAANQNVKILVPDNEFPSEANTFDIFGMEFAEFEVHIVHEKFKDAFGTGLRPRAKDYMFIPIINKMYEVSSVSIADEFNSTRSYWRVKLVKYQDRSSVIKGGYDSATDTLITGIEEVFGEEIKDEQTKDTNPVQFQAISNILEDGQRTYIDPKLVIKDEAIVNNFLTVSNNHYDLSNLTLNTPALKYNKKSNMITDGQLAVTAWIRPTFEITDETAYVILNSTGKLRIRISTFLINVEFNGVTHSFSHGTSMSKDRWYGVIVNVKNNTGTIDVALYSLSNVGHITTFDQEYTGSLPMTPYQQTWANGPEYELRGGKLNVSNIRIFDKAIESAEFENMLNQYVVHDNQHALLIDNAIPSLGYQKFKNAR